MGSAVAHELIGEQLEKQKTTRDASSLKIDQLQDRVLATLYSELQTLKFLQQLKRLFQC